VKYDPLLFYEGSDGFAWILIWKFFGVTELLVRIIDHLENVMQGACRSHESLSSCMRVVPRWDGFQSQYVSKIYLASGRSTVIVDVIRQHSQFYGGGQYNPLETNVLIPP
jgi:hypothetical protein